jgi:hypothetical protein
VPASHTNELIDDLEQLDEVIRLTAIREGSIKPPGGVLMVHTLNRGADKVMRLADTIRKHGQVSISTHELTSIVDPERHDKVSNGVDGALWEEAETGLRHQSRITPNYLALMALGGTIATTALVVESETQQAMATWQRRSSRLGSSRWQRWRWGLALRRWDVARRDLQSVVVGYPVLALSAALVFLALLLAGVSTIEEFVGNTEVETLIHPTLREMFLSASGAVAGAIMMTSYRLYLIPGALIALEIIEAAAMIGMALVAGEQG